MGIAIPKKTDFNSLWPSDAIWRHIWDNIVTGNGLVPSGTKPLPGLMLTNHQTCSVAFTNFTLNAQDINS